MPTNTASTKRLLIDKANARIVVYVSVAAFILIFSMVATKTLIGQANYQNKVISRKKTARNQLNADIQATDQLKTSYDAFTSTAQNVIGGDPGGSGPNDGDNARIILDALPSSYDFPGTATGIEALLDGQGVKADIGGTDDQVAQGSNQTSANPTAVPIPFTATVTGDYTGVQNAISAMNRSIRPIQIQSIDISGISSSLTLNVTAQTYYQPAKSLNIGKVIVK